MSSSRLTRRPLRHRALSTSRDEPMMTPASSKANTTKPIPATPDLPAGEPASQLVVGKAAAAAWTAGHRRSPREQPAFHQPTGRGESRPRCVRVPRPRAGPLFSARP
ncbi:hypothetical protein CDD83_9258 [Cordyceps sp. RAO-2017]|nr:hypothetical protein CDD83_9258 [Cordyceps sp. RAO-2017]